MPGHSTITRYAGGIALMTVAMVAAVGVRPVADQGAMLILVAGVALVAWLCGVGPALAAAAAASVLAPMLLFAPLYSFAIDGEDTARLLLLMATFVLVVVMVGALQRSRDRAEAAERAQADVTAVLDAVFENSTVGLGYWDRRLLPVRVNAALLDLGGLPGAAAERRREVLDSGRPIVGWEVEHGSGAHALVDLFPVRTASAGVAGVGAAVSDVSAVARMQAELRESRDQLALALEAARMGTWDWDVESGRLEWSGELEAIHGMLPGSFAGTFESFVEVIHPEDREVLQAAIAAALERRGPFQVEFRVIAHDGAVRWVSGEGRVVTGEDGRATRLVGVGRDVTARRRAEDALRESEERFRMLADSAPVLIWVSDADGGFTYVNAEWLRFTGHPLDHELGDGWLAGIAPDDLERWRVAHREAVRERAPFEIEFRLRRADGEHRWMLARGVPRGKAGRHAGHVGSCIDIHDRREAEERERLLAAIGVALDRPLGVADRLRDLARALLPSVADACAVDLLEPEGGLNRAAVAHVDPALEEIIARLPPPGPGSQAGRVAGGDGPILIAEVAEEDLARAAAGPEDVAARRRLEARSAVVVPLIARGVRIGALTLSTGRRHSNRAFDDADLRFAQEIARRAALAIENARLFEAEHAAAERVRFLAEASRLLGGSLDTKTTLAALARLAVPTLGDWCAVDLVEDGRVRSVAVVHSDPTRVALATELRERYPPDPGAATGAQAVIRTGEAQMVPRIDDAMLEEAAADERHLELLRSVGLRSFACVPLAARGRVLGALSVAVAESGRTYDQDDFDLVREVADRAAVAIDNARLYRGQHHIAETLQRALLPPELPRIPGAAAAARYLPMGEGVDAGGDFYDIFEVAPDRWMVVVGDVCGKGPEAASLTALARYTLRALAPDEPRPAALLAALNRAILRQRPGNTQFLTACALLVAPGPDGLLLEVACAGHPPPLVTRARGGCEWIGARGSVIGVFEDIRIEPVEALLSPGDRIVAYTDGVTEARAAGGLFGEAGLAGAADGGHPDPETLAGRIAEEVVAFQDGRLRDDVALLVIEAVAAGAQTPLGAFPS